MRKILGWVGGGVALVLLSSVAQAETVSAVDAAAMEERRNSVSIEWAGFLNGGDPVRSNSESSLSSDQRTYAALGLRYSRALLTGRASSAPLIEHSLSAELGVYRYLVRNLIERGDSYQAYPVEATIRYGVRPISFFEPFAYLGLIHHFASEPLERTLPAFGVGALLHFGQVFAARANVGTEGFNVGAVMSF